MDIEVELFGQLSMDRQRKQSLKLGQPLNVQEVAVLLGLNPEEIGLITINGVQSELEDSVPPDCRLCFFPHMSGG
jgi:hypothetical protein